MNVLSLFDGMSCGQQALERAGFKVNNYFASEIDKYAIQVTMANYPNTKQLGSVVNVDGNSLPKIDILIGGSPCQSFSFAGKRKGMSTKDEQEILTLDHYLDLKAEGFEFEGQSYLFWEYMRLLNETKPKYFLLENVMMGEKWEKVLSKAIGVKSIMINSSLVSAQSRQRLYWTNIGLEPQGLFGYLDTIIKQPQDKRILLKDVLELEVNLKYYLSDKLIKWLTKHSIKRGTEFKKKTGNDKSCCLTATAQAKTNLSSDYIIVKGARMTGRDPENPKSRKPCSNTKQMIEQRFDEKSGTLTTVQKDNLVINNYKIRRLTPVECERLQTVKDNYTNHVSDSQRYKMLGNGWTVDVIAHILKYMK
jgi:DNA (cytosine-5)-methyltransferase 3A